MNDLMLEVFFDNYIADSSWKIKEEEDDTDGQQQSNTDSQQTAEMERRAVPLLPGSSTSPYSNYQNATAAVLPGGSSMRAASPVLPLITVMPVMHPRMIPQIQNVCSTVKLGCCLNLKLIALNTWNVEHKPKRNIMIMRIRKPRATANIYRTGHVFCTGAKSSRGAPGRFSAQCSIPLLYPLSSLGESRMAARKFARKIQKLGFPVHFQNFKIQNVLSTCKTFPIDLTRLAHHHNCSYEPELLNGLLWSVKPGISATIFHSGRLIISGSKSEAEVDEAFHSLYPTLCLFRR